VGKKGRGSKGQGAKRSRKRPAKDLPAARDAGPRGGAGPSAAKLTFGAPSSRPITVDPSDPSGQT
jgi:hypothetical protein